jgi:hypothetical protein
MTSRRRREPCWYDVERAIKLLIGLAEGIAQLTKAIHRG